MRAIHYVPVSEDVPPSLLMSVRRNPYPFFVLQLEQDVPMLCSSSSYWARVLRSSSLCSASSCRSASLHSASAWVMRIRNFKRFAVEFASIVSERVSGCSNPRSLSTVDSVSSASEYLCRGSSPPSPLMVFLSLNVSICHCWSVCASVRTAGHRSQVQLRVK